MNNNFYSGLQIIKSDGTSAPQQEGFVTSNQPGRGGAFCRYWLPEGSQKLRTLANSEFTPYEFLRAKDTRHQSFVDRICGNLHTFNKAEIDGQEELPIGQMIIIYNHCGPAQNPLDPSYQVPIHHRGNGNYELHEPYTRARFFVVARVGGASDFAAYEGFISLTMPLDQGINTIARFGDKISGRAALGLIQKRNLKNLMALRYRG